MTEDQFDYLNSLRNRLEEDLDMTLPYSHAELVTIFRDRGYAEDARRLSELPDFRCTGSRVGADMEVRGMSGPGGVIGWLYPDGSCRLKVG